MAAARAGALVVTSNTRAARNLRHAYDLAQQRAGLTAWPSADFLPWSAWMQRLWEEHLLSSGGAMPILLDRAQERLLWQQVIAPGAAAELHLTAAARSAARSWRLLHEYKLDWQHPSFGARADSRAFRDWAQAFHKKCEQKNWLDAARLPAVLAQAVSGGELAVPSRLLLVGFDQLTPQQAALLAAMQARGMEWEQAAMASPVPAVRVAAADSGEELAAAARWARQKLEAGPEDVRIAVVVPNLQGLRSRVERIFLETLHPEALCAPRPPSRLAFDLSLGKPLSEHPLIAAALLGVRLLRGALSLGDAGRLLRSPFFTGAEAEHVSRALLDARLRRRGDEVTLRDLMDRGDRCPLLVKALMAAERACAKLPATALPGAWLKPATAMLDALGWPGPRARNSEEQQALAKWGELLSRVGALDLVQEPLSASAFCALLEELAGEQVFQPENEGAPIQILGMLEAAGSEFDHMWITGLHDGAWPSSGAPDPFLPIALQREHAMPAATARLQLESAARITQRLRASAADVVFSYPQSEGDSTLRPSPLLLDGSIATVALDVAPGEVATWSGALFNSCEHETFADDAGPALAEDTLVRGGTRLFRLQAECPFRAFAELRLGAGELESPAAGLDARARGTTVHLALQQVWEQLKDRAGLLACTGEARAALILHCVDRALADERNRVAGEWGQRILEIERERLAALLAAWLRLEERRADFRVLQREQQAEAMLGGVRVNIQADRVDELVPQGGHVVLDYKTGAVANLTKTWEGTRPQEPQLPVYAATMEGELAAIAFAQVRAEEPRFHGLATEQGILPAVDACDNGDRTLADAVVQWRAVLEQLGADFRAGLAPVDPRDSHKTCRYCHLTALCRIRERAPALADDGEEDGDGA